MTNDRNETPLLLLTATTPAHERTCYRYLDTQKATTPERKDDTSDYTRETRRLIFRIDTDAYDKKIKRQKGTHTKDRENLSDSPANHTQRQAAPASMKRAIPRPRHPTFKSQTGVGQLCQPHPPPPSYLISPTLPPRSHTESSSIMHKRGTSKKATNGGDNQRGLRIFISRFTTVLRVSHMRVNFPMGDASFSQGMGGREGGGRGGVQVHSQQDARHKRKRGRIPIIIAYTQTSTTNHTLRTDNCTSPSPPFMGG